MYADCGSLGIPVAYPRMVFLESALDSKLNPLVALGRNGSLGLSGFVNKFNADAELLDDLVRITNREVRNTSQYYCQNDHWTAKSHKVLCSSRFQKLPSRCSFHVNLCSGRGTG